MRTLAAALRIEMCDLFHSARGEARSFASSLCCAPAVWMAWRIVVVEINIRENANRTFAPVTSNPPVRLCPSYPHQNLFLRPASTRSRLRHCSHKHPFPLYASIWPAASAQASPDRGLRRTRQALVLVDEAFTRARNLAYFGALGTPATQRTSGTASPRKAVAERKVTTANTRLVFPDPQFSAVVTAVFFVVFLLFLFSDDWERPALVSIVRCFSFFICTFGHATQGRHRCARISGMTLPLASQAL